MSYAFSVSRRGVRTAAALGAATLGLLVTTGCGLTKPTPLATVTVGSDTVTTEAACITTEKKPLKSDDIVGCLEKEPGATITVGQGDRVHLGVEPEMAEAGWLFLVNQRPMSGKLNSTYQTVEAGGWFQPQPGQGGQAATAPKEVTLSVATVGEDEVAGVWNITIKREQ